MNRPNILLIHWHDTGRYLPVYGVEGVSAPSIEALANEGIVFDRAFSAAPLCSPARSSIFTGRYPHSNGVMGLAHLGWEYNSNEVTLPSMLRPLGYRSVLVGLQHESSNVRDLGFDEVHNLNAQEQYADPVAGLASIYLRDRARGCEPFFLSVGMFEPHRPFSKELYGAADPEAVTVPGYLPDDSRVREDLAEFAAAIAAADAATGRVLAALEETGLSERTVVVFTTDHGIPFPRAKSMLYDAGIGVSMIMRLPDGMSARQPTRVTNLFSHIDLAPTLIELVGGDVPHRVQGVSIAPWIAGENAWHREEVFAEKSWHDPDQYDPIRSVRDDRYAYIENWEDRDAIALSADLAGSPSAKVGEVVHATHRPRARVELFDTFDDPDEMVNRAEDPALAGERARLEKALHRWQSETCDPLLDGPIDAPRRRGHLQRHIVVAHPES